VVVAAWGAGGVCGDVSRDCAVPRVLGKAVAGVAGGGELSLSADGDHFARDSGLRCAAALEELGGQVLAVCTGLGAVHYILQGKGFPYHRYPVEAFLLLLCSLVLFPALRRGDWVRWPALLGVLLGACFLAPVSAQIACHYDWRNQEFNQMLAADLTQLGGQRLQNKVQCIDNTAGCPNTLYNLQLVQATGYLYSCYMLQPQPARFQDAYRAGFWRAMQANPPEVIVVSDQDCFTMHRSFDILTRWPQCATGHLLDSAGPAAGGDPRGSHLSREPGADFDFGFEAGRIARSLVLGQGYANPFNGPRRADGVAAAAVSAADGAEL
jgi:hypothetical protein